MAQDAGNILIGAATIYVDDYVAAGSKVGTPTEVGFSRGPTTITPAYTDYEVKAEQALMTIAKSATDAKFTVKIPAIEMKMANMAIALRQPAANITGTPPDETLSVDKPTVQYHQVKVSGPGLGTTSTRDIWAWKCIIQELSEIPVGKDSEQLLEMTLDILYDSSVSGSAKVMEITDS